MTFKEEKVGSGSNGSDSDNRTLSKREIQVLDLIGRGLTSYETAEMLFLSKRTVDYHLGTIYKKLLVSNRVQALHEALRLKREGQLGPSR